MFNILQRGVFVFIAVGLILNQAHSAELPNQAMSKIGLSKSIHLGDRFELPALDMTSLQTATKKQAGLGVPLKFAESLDHRINVASTGTWQTVNYAGQKVSIWRYVLSSPNAYSINLGFTKYKMPSGGRLFVYADSGDTVFGPFTHFDNTDDGQLWTPVISDRTIVIEVNIPSDQVDQLELELSHINQGFLEFEKLNLETSFLKSGSCNVDVACPASQGWEDQIRSVARYTISGQFLCTGAAINNVRRDGRPLFLTAQHCGVNINTDSSVVAYWNYQNSVCRTVNGTQSGLSGDGDLSTFSSGASYISGGDPDFTLIEFDSFPEDSNVYLSGWSRATSLPQKVVSIHHPGGGEKRISFENNRVTETDAGGTLPSQGGYVRVADWDLGTTEGGSSGGPLYDQNKRIIGQLLGGFAACGNNEPDWYGFVARSWDGLFPGSTTQATHRLRDWLDPLGANVTVLDGMNAIERDLFEADDIFPAAKAIVDGAPQNRTVHRPANEDWVRIEIDASGPAEVFITGMTPGSEIELSYYPGSMMSLSEPIASVVGTNPYLFVDSVVPSNYLVRVDPSRENGPTRYQLSFNEIRSDLFESDNSSVGASVINVGEVQRAHSIHQANDEDWVQFSVLEEMEVQIQTQGSNGDTFLRLYNSDLEEISSDDNGGKQLFSSIQLTLDVGTYFIQVSSVNDQLIGRYDLAVSEVKEDFLLNIIPAIIVGSKKN